MTIPLLRTFALSLSLCLAGDLPIAKQEPRGHPIVSFQTEALIARSGLSPRDNLTRRPTAWSYAAIALLLSQGPLPSQTMLTLNGWKPFSVREFQATADDLDRFLLFLEMLSGPVHLVQPIVKQRVESALINRDEKLGHLFRYAQTLYRLDPEWTRDVLIRAKDLNPEGVLARIVELRSIPWAITDLILPAMKVRPNETMSFVNDLWAIPPARGLLKSL